MFSFYTFALGVPNNLALQQNDTQMISGDVLSQVFIDNHKDRGYLILSSLHLEDSYEKTKQSSQEKKGNNLTSAQKSFGNRSVSDELEVANNEKYGCMRIHEIKESYKPDVLSQIIVDCLKNKKYKDAVVAYYLSLIRIGFDASRIEFDHNMKGEELLVSITDIYTSAWHISNHNLAMELKLVEEWDRFNDEIDSVNKNRSRQKAFTRLFCKNIDKLSIPSYIPKEMILMFKKTTILYKNEDISHEQLLKHMRRDFDSEYMWSIILNDAFNCSS